MHFSFVTFFERAAVPIPTLGSILSPGYNAQFYSGQKYNITWTAASSITIVQLYVYIGVGTSGAVNYVGFITLNAPNTGSYLWTVPNV